MDKITKPMPNRSSRDGECATMLFRRIRPIAVAPVTMPIHFAMPIVAALAENGSPGNALA